jgi:hypothetical protein
MPPYYEKEIQMKTVYKYLLPFNDDIYLELPKNAQILSAVNQYEEIVIYALVDPEETCLRVHTFRIVGTGHIIGHNDLEHYHFLNTVSLRKGALMFHIFYR